MFNYGPNARKHVKIHGYGLEPAAERTCPFCGKLFRYATLCKLHVKRTCRSTAVPRQSISCDQCDQPFDTRKQLSRHVRTEHGGAATEQLRCKLCRQLFRGEEDAHACSSSRQQQALSETGFQCDECDKRYTTKGALKLHIETIHRGVRFPCPQCPEDSCLLSNKQALERHIRNVHEVAVCLFKCDTCDSAFKVLLSYSWQVLLRLDASIGSRRCIYREN